ncbi:MAPEG family protein [Agaribacter flavus]|uniref:MAPEG family protein n=1 Tax=Agaribacter flavus TaxID=1902781 RepID=A0ABV7FSY1_9ALTE
MNATILALGGYIFWLMVLLLSLAVIRTIESKKRSDKSLKFDPNGADLGNLGQRLTRAHLNTVESFPFVCGVMLLALATDSSAISNGLAFVVLGARIIQSSVHILSVSNNAITLRFVFFLIQFGIAGYWLCLIIYKFL